MDKRQEGQGPAAREDVQVAFFSTLLCHLSQAVTLATIYMLSLKNITKHCVPESIYSALLIHLYVELYFHHIILPTYTIVLLSYIKTATNV